MASRSACAVAVVALAAAVGLCVVGSTPGASGAQVAAGVYEGNSWSLVASDDSTGSYCLTTQLRGQQDATGCGSIYAGRAHGVSYLASQGPPGPNYIVGPVTSRATRVRIDLVGGTRLTVPAIGAPSSLSTGIAFYVHFAHCIDKRPTRITGFDRDGHAVATLSVSDLTRPLVRTPPCAAASTGPVAGFGPAAGWVTVRAGANNPSLVVAVTAKNAAAVHPVALFNSFKKLTSDGILITVDTAGRNRKAFPTAAAWPPRLARFRNDRLWEGQPVANIQQRTWVRSVRGWDLDIRVYFGTQSPTTALLARAQAELDRLRLPSG